MAAMELAFSTYAGLDRAGNQDAFRIYDRVVGAIINRARDDVTAIVIKISSLVSFSRPTASGRA